jgi:hypothetical protein
VKELLAKIVQRLESGSYINEAAVRIGIIEPILARLGWDLSDPQAVQPEFSSEGRRVDYALCAFPARPTVFIEAKAIGKVEAADRQLFEYAFHEGVPFAVLTDGRTWSFYLPSAQGSYEDRRLYKLDLQERDATECERIFTRYLAYNRLKTGDAQSDAQKDHSSRANERMASEMLSRAWTEIINEPDPLLIDLLVERTEALCGIRPALEAAESFLLAPEASQPSLAPPPHPPRARARTIPQPPLIPLPREIPARGKVFASFRGRQLEVRDATSGFLQILKAILGDFPDRAEQIATAAKGRSRNHIARRPVDVYPDRPDLVHTVVELIPGWFVGTNIANREKRRIVAAACQACGLHFGKDLQFEIPNT